MLIKILLVIAILIQTVATAYALKLVRATKYNSVDSLHRGFSLLSVERFVQLLMASGQYVPRWWFAYLGIVISDLPVDRRDVRPQALQVHRQA